MKILLSAYACEPHKGSEPGVGWHWAIELARLGHEVWVLTRANNRQVIEAEFSQEPQPANLHFFYYDLPAWAKWWKKGGRGVHLYYLLWQWGAYRLARQIHARERFDVVHHITFGVIRQPSFMGGLGIPFIFGPVGGGEKTPLALRKGYPWRGKFFDGIRDVLNFLIRYDPMMWHTFHTASVIYAKTSESASIIPKCFRRKIKVQLEIGIDTNAICTEKPSHRSDGTFRILYVGRFLYWKGMHLGLSAFANFVKVVPTSQLTMVGKGPEKKAWEQLSKTLGVADNINWVDWVAQDDLGKLYLSHDVFLFPSLHDSSGNVVLEAMAHGLPVVCLDLGGPGAILGASACGQVISTYDLDEQEVVWGISNSLQKLHVDVESREKLRGNATKAAKNRSWEKVVSGIYKKCNLYER